MTFTSRIDSVPGRSPIGTPTLVLHVPETLPISVPRGSYAVRAKIGHEVYAGVLEYAPDPLVGGDDRLVLYPLDTVMLYAAPGNEIAVEMVRNVHAPQTFEFLEQYVRALETDAAFVRTLVRS